MTLQVRPRNRQYDAPRETASGPQSGPPVRTPSQDPQSLFLVAAVLKNLLRQLFLAAEALENLFLQLFLAGAALQNLPWQVFHVSCGQDDAPGETE